MKYCLFSIYAYHQFLLIENDILLFNVETMLALNVLTFLLFLTCSIIMSQYYYFDLISEEIASYSSKLTLVSEFLVCL